MNRFKKELRKNGVMLECDYPWLPYEHRGCPALEGVHVDSEKCTVTRYFVSITLIDYYNRQMERDHQDFE